MYFYYYVSWLCCASQKAALDLLRAELTAQQESALAAQHEQMTVERVTAVAILTEEHKEKERQSMLVLESTKTQGCALCVTWRPMSIASIDSVTLIWFELIGVYFRLW